MSEVPSWRRYLRFWGADPEADIRDELGFHIAMKETELMAKGVPRDRVEREAERAFGDRERVEAELKEIGRRRQRRARRAGMADNARTDLVHAWRSFRRKPGIPLVVIATLAIGIGAGTAVFSLFDAVVLNPLAVHRADELMMLQENRLGVSYPMLQHVREGSTLSGGVAGSLALGAALRTAEQAEQLQAGLVTGNYFSVLGMTPQAGRLLQPADEAAPGSTPYVVLSDALWRREFGGDERVVGSRVWINEAPFTVVGVAAPRFRGTSLSNPVDLWLPLTMLGTVARSGLYADPESLTTWHFSLLEPIVRIPAGREASALAELSALHAAAIDALPELASESTPVLSAMPLNERAAAGSREDLLRFLRLLAMVVAIALVIACVNVANLMLMRSRERRREMSVRAALGASRGRVVRQLLIESTVLALLAGALGVGVALLSMRLLTAFSLPGGIALQDVSFPLDLRVLGFTAGVSLLCAVAFGLAPAVAGSRTDVMDTLRGGAEPDRGRRWRGGNVLVALQVGLSLVLLVTGSLFVRSLQQALRVDLGFRSAGIGAVSVGLRQHGYDEAQADVFIHTVLEQAARQPGIARVAASTRVPMEGATRLPVSPELPAPGEPGVGPRRALLQVSPGYLDLFGLRLVRGRDIDWTDREGTPLVALVTEQAAREMWPGEDPLGRQFVIMFGQPFTVVGVIADAHFTALTEREPHILLPLLQRKVTAMDRMRLSAAGPDAAAAITGLRHAVNTVDRRLPTFEERSLQQQVEAVLMPQRFGSLLLAVFGAIALMIAAVGIYAVAAYDVARRRRELGIRSALGASGIELARAVLGPAWIAICVGTVAGLTAAAYTTQAVRSLLFGITPYEPVSYAAAALLLSVVALMASWIPARRAARVDPIGVMRE